MTMDFQWLCAALGNFDGVHRGHVQVITRTVTLARQMRLKPAAFLFEVHPAKILQPDTELKFIMDNREKKEILKGYGIEQVIFYGADKAFFDLPGEEFIHGILFRELGVHAAVCGYNYQFGSGGQWDAGDLQSLGEKYGISVHVQPCEKAGELVPSSSLIRSLLERGDIENANYLLSRPFTRTARVVKGSQLGRRYGVPTANQVFDSSLILPQNGVYITRALVDGVSYPATTNIGTRPTVSGEGITTAETYVSGFDGDLYGRQIKLMFYRKIRGEKRFESLDCLFAQIRRDIQTSETYWQDKEGYIPGS